MTSAGSTLSRGATRVRFAPSPNGPLHLGHAYSALLNHELAVASNGTMLLRMENIDLARCSLRWEAAIREDLSWLGIAWQEPIRRQSEHFKLYRTALDDLAAQELLYPCFCTRGDIARAIGGREGWRCDPDGSPLYPGTCRHLPAAERDRRLAAGQSCSLRLDMGAALRRAPGPLVWIEWGEGSSPDVEAAVPERWGDAVLRRRDVPASYHIAVVVDDAAQGVTDVVRGADLRAATGLHRLLQTLLGYAEPTYHHHRLMLDRQGHKLAKSRNAPALAELRHAGSTADDVRQLLGR